MSKEALNAFIREQYHDGIPRERVYSLLSEKGWAIDMIEVGIAEVYDKNQHTSHHIQGIKEIFNQTIATYKNKPLSFLSAGAVAIALPLLIIALFSLPLHYAFIQLELQPKDFLTLPLLPFLISHLSAGVLFTILFGSLGNIILLQTVTRDGNISIEESSRKAWSLLPGYILIMTEKLLIKTLLILPGITYIFILVRNFFQKVGSPITPESIGLALPHTGHIYAAIAILILPSLCFSLFSTFSIFAYLIHGTRGFKAIQQSIHLTAHYWKSILWKLTVFSIVFGLISAIISSVIPIIGSFIAVVVIPPATLITFVTVFKNHHAVMSTEQSNKQMEI